MIIDNQEKAIEIFVDAAKNHAKASEEGNFRVVNKNYDKIIEAVNFLKKDGSI